MKNNIVRLADSYKYSQFYQYSDGLEYLHSYLSSRGGKYKSTVMSGLQYYLKEFFTKQITKEQVDEVARKAQLHGVSFNYDGWMKVIEKHNGFLPLSIKAAPEGSVVPAQNTLLTIENTDPEFAWLVSPMETLLLKIWYPITVATKSYEVRKMIEEYHQDTVGHTNGVAFAFHNFGDRGSSCVEAAALAGMAHLTQFMGTDNFNSLFLIDEYYGEECAGYSINASEHSVMTLRGREGEYDIIEQYLEKSKGRPMIACVMDSYDVYKAVDFITTKLKDKIESDEYPVFVIRPDSGEPLEVIESIIHIMERNGVAYTSNDQGLLCFNKFRLIWGDGITPETIKKILDLVTKELGYSADVIAFGSGGDLCQNVNRDTNKFAIKASAAVINGVESDVFKDPITDPGKASKKGRTTLIRWKSPGWSDYKVRQIDTIRQEDLDTELQEDLLVEVFRNGKILKEWTFQEIRDNSRKEP